MLETVFNSFNMNACHAMTHEVSRYLEPYMVKAREFFFFFSLFFFEREKKVEISFNQEEQLHQSLKVPPTKTRDIFHVYNTFFGPILII